ncbi:large subunit ribosomal protein L23 [Halogranum amylolyticum]|uniref:Large ribosomal subunit protein uL23 n=1 Tax=Halogranum amylolyticum TaxID=660520 RepID=A0A1H8NCI0_9EURY|nr:50S ribosomal protein L23 [Halogranum amylolyticum]SEO27208.1 large subunit ribosomal protein L23 [Halogranum amylolyticum]
MSVIEHPLVTEKAMNQMDFDNKLQFIVHIDATKGEIVEEIESRYEVTIQKVNTQVTPKGKKKAIVTLGEDDDAQEVASRIGVF